MALSIKSQQADQLARHLAKLTGESMTEAIEVALRERVDRLERSAQLPDFLEEVKALQERIASYPVLDPRSADEILGYDENGLPT